MEANCPEKVEIKNKKRVEEIIEEIERNIPTIDVTITEVDYMRYKISIHAKRKEYVLGISNYCEDNVVTGFAHTPLGILCPVIFETSPMTKEMSYGAVMKEAVEIVLMIKNANIKINGKTVDEIKKDYLDNRAKELFQQITPKKTQICAIETPCNYTRDPNDGHIL